MIYRILNLHNMAYIKVRVFTNAKKVRIIKKTDDAFVLYVREKPELGRANEAALELLARELKVHMKSLRIVRGSKSPHKLIELITIK